MYSTGSSARCSVMTKRGGDEAQEEGDIYTQLIRFVVQHIVKQLCTNEKKLKRENKKPPNFKKCMFFLQGLS